MATRIGELLTDLEPNLYSGDVCSSNSIKSGCSVIEVCNSELVMELHACNPCHMGDYTRKTAISRSVWII